MASEAQAHGLGTDTRSGAGRVRERLERAQLRRLRLASLVEGATLVALVFVAVPLKHLAGWPIATSVMGPVHGLAFMAYVWTVVETVSGGGWSRGEVARLLFVAFVPFGGFTNGTLLNRKQAALDSPASPASPAACVAEHGVR